jgi:hypothetical protein
MVERSMKCSVLATSLRRAAFVAVVAVCLGLGGCCTSKPYQVDWFNIDRSDMCSGDTATARWSVTGPATLRVSQGDASSPDEKVSSTGQQSFSGAVKTTIRITATKQNPALGNYKEQSVNIAGGTRAGPVILGSDGSNTTVFTPYGSGVRVRGLSAPVVVAGGRDASSEICVSHPGMTRRCIKAGGAEAVDAPFDGPWILEATLPSGSPPAQNLKLNFDVTCAPH